VDRILVYRRSTRLAAFQNAVGFCGGRQLVPRSDVAGWRPGFVRVSSRKAEQAFARFDTAESNFNRGNALMMQGKYDAASARYDRALELHPGRADAETNRKIAVARAALMKTKEATRHGGQVKPDDFVFDNNAKNAEQTMQTQGDKKSGRSGHPGTVA
jgi:Ca-activated chloride channel family protein